MRAPFIGFRPTLVNFFRSIKARVHCCFPNNACSPPPPRERPASVQLQSLP